MRYTMSFLTQNCFHTLRGTALSGLLVGFDEVLIYSLAFALYAIARSSIHIGTILSPTEGLVGALIANAFSLLMAILGFCLLFGIFAAVLETSTLLLIYGLAVQLNPQGFQQRGVWIGLTTSVFFVGAIQFFVQQSLGSYFAALWPSGYFFWLGLPSLLFIGVNGWLSGRFAHQMQTDQTPHLQKRGGWHAHATH